MAMTGAILSRAWRWPELPKCPLLTICVDACLIVVHLPSRHQRRETGLGGLGRVRASMRGPNLAPLPTAPAVRGGVAKTSCRAGAPEHPRPVGGAPSPRLRRAQAVRGRAGGGAPTHPRPVGGAPSPRLRRAQAVRGRAGGGAPTHLRPVGAAPSPRQAPCPGGPRSRRGRRSNTIGLCRSGALAATGAMLRRSAVAPGAALLHLRPVGAAPSPRMRRAQAVRGRAGGGAPTGRRQTRRARAARLGASWAGPR
jgi:hypothetical protein